MVVIQDPEFGKITVRRTANATQVKIRLAADGSLRASMPVYAPIFLLKRLIKSSRPKLREVIKQARKPDHYYDGMEIGKSHSLAIVRGLGDSKITRSKQKILVDLGRTGELTDPDILAKVRQEVIKALRSEAKSYLPRRLQFLAAKHGYSYTKTRFSHASSRWGSCSAKGTISLNIALMKLPFEIIDYVLIHELVHTQQMNHSQLFWQLVESADPDYKAHRKALKEHSPNI